MPGPLTEGERWACEELSRLREKSWSPPAVLRFLAASQRRANRTRRRRSPDARRAARWLLFGAVAWVVAAGTMITGDPGARRRLQAGGLGWWAACALMLDWHLGMLETPDGRPVALGAADALTLLRAWLVPAVACDAVPAAAIVGALSDLADGVVARRTRTTRLGRDLEGLVDACFTGAALRSALHQRRISRFPVALELVRLAAGTGYVSVVYFVAGHAPDRGLSGAGRRAAPLRMASLVAAGHGRRQLADRLLLAGTGLALWGLLGRSAAGTQTP